MQSRETDSVVAAPRGRETAPGFHFLRHLLSVIILAFHSYVLAFGGNGNLGYAKGALLGTAWHLTSKQLVIEMLRPGLFALVGMFFALSGFLVMGSALRTRDPRQFFTLRALRILPALCTEVTLSAFILGAAVTDLSPRQYFTNTETYTYLGNIVGLMQYTLPGVFTTNPLPDFVNINLWTLHPEAFCYIMMGVLMVTGVLYKTRAVTCLIVGAVVLAAIVAAIPSLGLPDRYEATHFQGWFLVVIFAMGMAFRLHKAIIPINVGLFVACGLGYFGLMISGACDTLAAVLLTYVMVYLGARRFTWFDRIVKDDCSYGIYLYGYPITQAIVYLSSGPLRDLGGAPRLMIVMSLSVSLTWCFALLSWRVIEKPALKLKSILSPRRVVDRSGFAALDMRPQAGAP